MTGCWKGAGLLLPPSRETADKPHGLKRCIFPTGYTNRILYINEKLIYIFIPCDFVCVCVSAYFFIGFLPRSAVEFVAGYSNDPPSVSLLKLRLHVKQCRHPLWPLIFSAAGTGCHIPRIAMFERGIEGGVAAEERWQDCSESWYSNARYE